MPDEGPIVPLTRPVIGEAELAAVRRPLLSGWLTQGPEVAAFEQEFAAYVGAAHACAVSSCTTALHLALRACGVGPGDEVVTVSHSFVATTNSIRYCGAIPVFVDIDPDTFNMDPRRIEPVLGDRTRAILCVHQLGMPCDLAAVLDIAHRHSLPVVEDAACAIGSEICWQGRWQKIGRPHGDIACFSFHPRKVITTGDGGMLTTSNPLWDKQFRLWRQHGMTVPDTARHATRQVIFEQYEGVGYNYRMTDLQAAIGRAQLPRLPHILSRRRYLADRYRARLAGVPGIRLPADARWTRTNWQSYCVRLPERCDQRQVMQMLLDEGISTRRGVMCAHREPDCADGVWSCGEGPDACGCPPGACRRLQESERSQDRCVLLPLYPEMSERQQDRVISSLLRAVATASR